MLNAGAARSLQEVQTAALGSTSTARPHLGWPLHNHAHAGKRTNHHFQALAQATSMQQRRLLINSLKQQPSGHDVHSSSRRQKGNIIDCDSAGGWLLTAGKQPTFRRLMPGDLPADCMQ